MKKDDVLIITGPTASGKSQRALEMAEELGGEIINADSMQLYEHLPILTACPSQEDCQRVPHHLYQILGDHQMGSVAWWVEQVEKTIGEIVSRGNIPLIVGGTGLYIQGLTHGLSPIPDISDHYREQARACAAEMDSDAFYNYVCSVDPQVPQHLLAGDTQRLTRVLEVMLATGKSLYIWQQEPRRQSPYIFQKEVLLPDREDLYGRINRRFVGMIQRGAVEEVAAMLTRSVNPVTPILKAVGVKEISAYLRGEISQSQMIEQAQQASRRYAKRQMTWLRTQG